VHLVPHFDKFVIVQNVDFEFSVQSKRIVWILRAAHCCLTKLWHKPWLVVVYVLVRFKQEVVEFLTKYQS
jgi:hypothetical protein